MSVTILNPYGPPSTPWLRGNLHTHTTDSDGCRSPQDAIRAYAALGYDFLMISDHDVFADHTPLDDCGLVLIPGNEITAHGTHILHVGGNSHVPPQQDRQAVIDAINADGGFAVIAHPNWEHEFDHAPQADLEAWQGYTGIEIYNGVVRWLRGSPTATDRWDRLLGAGRRVWGFAHDDNHRESNEGLAWNMVQADARTPAAIVDALRHGRFYATTGVILHAIHVDGPTITVETENAERIAAHSDFGFREAEADGPSIRVTVPENAPCKYIRIECWGRGEAMAWTQPFFIQR